MLFRSNKAGRRLSGIRWALIGLVAALLVACAVLAQEEKEDLGVFWKWARWSNPGGFLIGHCIRQADRLYEARDGEISRLKSEADWLKRQQRVKSALADLMPLPKRTPLNARVLVVIEKNGYRVEKVVYESMPRFFVTGCLFVPRNAGPKCPAVLNVIGHNQDAFRDELYQTVYLNLVRKGFVVLAIDPLGQGEDVQYYDPAIQLSSIGYTVIEHCYFGNQCFLSGVSPARYFAWDGIRGIDYLLTRTEVDPDRVAVTGFSGGGTVASYIGALDERVKVSIPCSWSTASRRQTETKGAQDAESVFVRGLAKGITFEDLVEVRAPRPTLMTFTSRDEYLSIQGAREAYQEIRGAYAAFGREENVGLEEDDYKHWMTPPIRRAIYAFLMKHLGISGQPDEEKIEPLSKEELKVTPTGQISTSFPRAESVFSINRSETEALLERLSNSRKDIAAHVDRARKAAVSISGYKSPGDSPAAFFNGRYRRDGYSIAKFGIRGEGDYVIPALLFVPSGAGRRIPGLVYVHPQGKAQEARPGGEIETLVKAGFVVAAIDVLGAGETANTVTRAIAPEYTGVMTGRSTVATRAGDIVRTVNWLKQVDSVDPQRIGAAAVGVMGIPLLHAAAFESSIAGIVVQSPLISYRSVVMNRFYRIGLIRNEGGGLGYPYEVDFSWGVAGALTGYDLPDLVGCIAPRRIALAGPQSQQLEPASPQEIEMDTAFPRAAYARCGAPENLRIVQATDPLVELAAWALANR
jgi:cephalosporin-C deacetylase-like acetyl esterase